MYKQILHVISIWIVVLPVTAGFINYRGLNKDSKWIFYLSLIAVIPQVMTFGIKQETVLLNISYNIYTPIEFVVFFILFKSKYHQHPNKTTLIISAALYGLISMALIVREGITDHFINSWVCANNLFYIVWVLLFFKEQFYADSFMVHKSNPFAWYLLAIIIYAPLTLISFAMYHYTRESDNAFMKNFSLIQDCCNILMYLLFATGLFVSKKGLYLNNTK